ELHAQLAYILCDAGQLDQAIREYKMAIDLDRYNYYYWMNLGYTYIGNKQFPDALNAIQTAITQPEGDKSRYAWASLAACYKKMGEATKYTEYIGKALQLKPHDDDNEYTLASFEALCGQKQQALDLLSKALEKKWRTKAFAARDWDFDFIS